MSTFAQALTEWDRAAFVAINSGLRSPLLDCTMPAITDLGLGHVQALIALSFALALGIRASEVRSDAPWRAGWLALRAQRAWLGPLLMAYLMTLVVVTAIKTIPRDRPWWFYLHEHRVGRHLDVKVHTVEGVRPIRVRGFPSGHTAATAAMAMVFTLTVGRHRGRVVWAWVAVAVIGFSRIYLADHWPLDVLGGAAVGVAMGYLAVKIYRWKLLEGQGQKE
ncbi:MAG TPA: phosphatase PAP2 family protein [Chthonomonadales bacterium]|nr:phosphatase PAP2 family protein [Chthonomonadales bacterium]